MFWLHICHINPKISKMNKIFLTSLFALLGMGAFAQSSNGMIKNRENLSSKKSDAHVAKGNFKHVFFKTMLLI